MSNRIIELHDSTVSTITIEDRSVIVNFSAAYIHKSEDDPGIPGTGWIQSARLVIKEASTKGEFISSPSTILDGVLWVGDVEHSNFIPIPFDTVDNVRLRLEFHSGNGITFSGKGATLELFGDPKFIEEFIP